MNVLKNISLGSKLTVISMVACTIALVLAGAAFIIYDHQQMKSSMVRELQILADVIGANCTAAIAFDNSEDAAETLASLAVEDNVDAAYVYRRDGSVLAQYVRGRRADPEVPTPVMSQSHHFSADFLELTRDIMLEGERTGVIHLRVLLKPLDDRLANISMAVSVVILGTSLIVLLVVSRLQRLISQPILTLATTAKQISASRDYSVRVPLTSQDEVGTLVEQFNDMLSQVQTQDAALQKAHNELEQRIQERTWQLEQEVVEHERSKKQIAASLKEKEVLLKEIHHRVKNNLQIVTSLLNLQAGQVTDPETQAIFKDSMGRVKSMALIHERLYKSDNIAEIDFAEYVGNLTRYLLGTISGNRERIRITQTIANIRLGIDTAVPCALIINELVTNSLKYGFPNYGSGQIVITCTRDADGRISLSVSDDGIGIPPQIDIEHTKSLGMQLVHSLTEQLNGSIQLDREQGTRFTIEFGCKQRSNEEKCHAVA